VSENTPGKSGQPTPAALAWIKSAAKSIDALAGWVKGVALAITATTAVLIFFFPACEPPKPCRGTLDGTLTSPSVDQSVRYRSYLERIGASKGEASQARLDEIGKVIDFQIITAGYKNTPLQIVWWLLSGGGEPTGDPRLNNPLGVVVRPQDCMDKAREKIWVGPIPRTRHTYLVEIRLIAPNGSELGHIQTHVRGLG
jgi:hypothetical protein